jgi:hypothetical protein
MKVDLFTTTCSAADAHTDTQLSIVCDDDSNCAGTNSTAGVCSCGLSGVSYCSLMSEDAPFLRLKEALIDFDYEQIAAWEFATDFWVNL